MQIMYHSYKWIPQDRLGVAWPKVHSRILHIEILKEELFLEGQEEV